MFDSFAGSPMIGSIAGMGETPAPAMQFNPLLFTPAAPSNQYNDFLSQPTFNIRGLFLQETGTYNDQFHRPYKAMMDNNSVRMMQNRVEQATSNDPSMTIQAELISGLCSGVIAPSPTHEGGVGIVNGWGEKRFRFILVVECPNAFTNDIYIFQGYSEFFDRTIISGHVDPRMIFFINSEIRLQRALAKNNFGYNDRLGESRQFIDGRILSNNAASQVEMLRPRDLISGIQTNHINSGVGASVMVDSRAIATNDVVSNTRKNGVPSRYLARTISTHRNTQSIGNAFDEGGSNPFDRTIQALHEPSPNENPFIQRLTDMTGFSAFTKNTFTLQELAKIDPTIESKVNYSPVDPRVSLHTTGASSYLNGSNIETMMGAMISNGIAGLMIEAGLSFVSFMTSTMTPTGQPNTTMISPGRPMTTQNPLQAYGYFITLFNTTLLPDLSRNFTIPFTATIVADLFGDVEIVVMIDGSTPERCVFPAFADSLITPIATRNHQNFMNMAAGVEDLINACGFDQLAINNEIASHFIENV